MLCDALIIVSMGILSGVVYHLETIGTPGDLVQFGGFAAVVAALFIALGKSRDLYELPELLNFKSQICRITIKWFGIFLFLTAVAFTMKVGGALLPRRNALIRLFRPRCIDRLANRLADFPR